MSRKSQVALEFLTTYAWAILVIIIMIAAFLYFGVFNPKETLPDRCSIGPEFGCMDYTINSNGLTLKLKNSVGKPIIIDSITVSTESGPLTCDALENVGPDTIWDADDARVIPINCGADFATTGFAEGKKGKLKLDITYHDPKSGSQFSKDVKAEMIGTVKGSGVTCVAESGKCSDTIDNDCDSCTDGADSDCNAKELICGDGIDNDCDTKTDCADTDCASGTESICNDGIDNDCDSKTDCADADCVVGTESICNDGKDNDCDGKIDCADENCLGEKGCPVVFSGSFTGGQLSTQCTAWTNFRGKIDSGTTYQKITISGTFDATGVSCTGPTANTICQYLKSGLGGSWSCGGRTWQVYPWCGGVELNAYGSGCSCQNPGYVVRPCIGNSAWGGANTDTCYGPTQTITVRCE